MRVFGAGGAGLIGQRLVPRLAARGHQVTATATGPGKLGPLRQLGECAGAKPPMRAPTWPARLLAGDRAVAMMTEGRAFSHARVKRELGWEPRYPSRRQGFKEELA